MSFFLLVVAVRARAPATASTGPILAFLSLLIRVFVRLRMRGEIVTRFRGGRLPRAGARQLGGPSSFFDVFKLAQWARVFVCLYFSYGFILF